MLSPGEAAVIAPWIVGLAGVVALQFDAVPLPSSSTADVAAEACPAPSSANAAARAAPVRSLLMEAPCRRAPPLVAHRTKPYPERTGRVKATGRVGRSFRRPRRRFRTRHGS